MNSLTYEYVAVDNAGNTQRGSTPAATKAEAFRALRSRGLTPVQLRKVGSSHRRTRNKRIPRKKIAAFIQQFSVLVGARISISDGLLSIAEQEDDPRVRQLARDIAAGVESGSSIAESMAAHQAVLGDVVIETVRAAERSGSLTKILDDLSQMLEREQAVRAQVRGAMMYPACVMGVLVLAVAFLVGVVIPRFARMYESRGIDLPLLTKIVLGIGESMHNLWWAWLAGIVGIFLTAKILRTKPAGKVLIESILARLPVVGSARRSLAIGRFCRVMGVSVGAGLGLIECVELAGRASGRQTVAQDAEKIIIRIRSGETMRSVLPHCESMTPLARRMLASGEESGEVPRMCELVARQSERETSELIKGAATAIEPILVVLIAVVVLFVALAIFLPMWNMVALIG